MDCLANEIPDTARGAYVGKSAVGLAEEFDFREEVDRYTIEERLVVDIANVTRVGYDDHRDIFARVGNIELCLLEEEVVVLAHKVECGNHNLPTDEVLHQMTHLIAQLEPLREVFET